MRFLILGCNGMAGHTISLYLKERGHDVFGFDRRLSGLIPSVTGDALDANCMEELIGADKYDTVINCIGLLNRACDENKAAAVYLNSYLPHLLAKLTEHTKTQIIHNKLQQNAFCVVSDSGTLPEESAYFGFPAVSVRTSTERPEAMEKGVFTIGSITREQVLQAVDLAASMYRNGDLASNVPAYTDTNVSTKVIKLIQSYVGIVNRMVWRKQ